MDKIIKALNKLTAKEKATVEEILMALQNGQTANLDLKKLKGHDDIFRVRKGRIRIVYQSKGINYVRILIIERKNDHTYKNI